MTNEPELQYIVDATGKRIAVILPIEEYEALAHPGGQPRDDEATSIGSLFGILRHLGTPDVSPEAIDEARRELWGDWEKKEF